MTPSQARKKGYAFACQVADRLKLYARDYADEIVAALPHKHGVDIEITGAALDIYPLAWECKFRKTISIKEWYRQAEQYRTDEQRPIVAFKMAQSGVNKEDQKVLVCLDLDDFLKLIR